MSGFDLYFPSCWSFALLFFLLLDCLLRPSGSISLLHDGQRIQRLSLGRYRPRASLHPRQTRTLSIERNETSWFLSPGSERRRRQWSCCSRLPSPRADIAGPTDPQLASLIYQATPRAMATAKARGHPSGISRGVMIWRPRCAPFPNLSGRGKIVRCERDRRPHRHDRRNLSWSILSPKTGGQEGMSKKAQDTRER